MVKHSELSVVRRVCSHYSSLALIVLPHRIFASSSLTYVHFKTHTHIPHIYHTLDKTDHTTQIECVSQDDIKPPRSTLTHRRRASPSASMQRVLYSPSIQYLSKISTATTCVRVSNMNTVCLMLAESPLVTFGFFARVRADRSRTGSANAGHW